MNNSDEDRKEMTTQMIGKEVADDDVQEGTQGVNQEGLQDGAQGDKQVGRLTADGFDDNNQKSIIEQDPARRWQYYQQLVHSLSPFYVFGFGSLMWSPGFDYEQVVRAVATGFHRRFGLWSFHYRGTREQPGLVLGIDKGGQCEGLCYRVADKNRDAVAKILWDREMVSYAYDPRAINVILQPSDKEQLGGSAAGQAVKLQQAKGEQPKPEAVMALAFALDPASEQYVGHHLSFEQQAQIIATAGGLGGPNRDYFLNMVKILQDLNIHDGYIAQLAAAFEKYK